MNDIAIYGCGGFGREVKALIDQINMKGGGFNFIGFFDDGVEKGKVINNFPVIYILFFLLIIQKLKKFC
jgi:hypothetical protein